MEALAIISETLGPFVEFFRSSPPFFLLGHAIILVVGYQVVKISVLLSLVYFGTKKTTKKLTSKYQRFSFGGGRKILIAGDSTAVGTGAKFPGNTIAGMLGQDNPDAYIFNAARNGALTSDILEQLKNHEQTHYDAIIISSGGNDIWSLITTKSIGKSLSAVIEKSKAISSGHVVVLFFGNIGSAPIFPWVVRFFLMRREKRVLEVFKEVCSRTDTHLIQLFVGDFGNPFVEHPELYFSADRLHPNDNGYALWYKHIRECLQKSGFLREKN